MLVLLPTSRKRSIMIAMQESKSERKREKEKEPKKKERLALVFMSDQISIWLGRGKEEAFPFSIVYFK